MGIPSTFTQETADHIVEQLSLGVPLAVICRGEGMPAVRTVSDWKKAHEEFAAAFAQARDDGYDALAAQCLEIANTPQVGIVEKLEPVIGKNGRPTTKLVVVERSLEDMLGHRKLQIETRLKLLAKWDPKRYGEKVTNEHTGPGGGPVQIVATPHDEAL